MVRAMRTLFKNLNKYNIFIGCFKNFITLFLYCLCFMTKYDGSRHANHVLNSIL